MSYPLYLVVTNILVLGVQVKSHETHAFHVAKDHTPSIMLDLGSGSQGMPSEITGKSYEFKTLKVDFKLFSLMKVLW